MPVGVGYSLILNSCKCFVFYSILDDIKGAGTRLEAGIGMIEGAWRAVRPPFPSKYFEHTKTSAGRQPPQ